MSDRVHFNEQLEPYDKNNPNQWTNSWHIPRGVPEGVIPITVKELIKMLWSVPPDALVYIPNEEYRSGNSIMENDRPWQTPKAVHIHPSFTNVVYIRTKG